MIMELPKKFKAPSITCTNYTLIINHLVRYETLMYNLSKACKGNKCIYCGKKMRRSNFTLDHRYPRAIGGISITNNLFPCCSTCNVAKGNLTHEEFLEIIKLSKKDRKIYLRYIQENNNEIFKNSGFKLPKKWVTYENSNVISYQTLKSYIRGKKYNKIAEFYNAYGNLPRPIIVDKNNLLLEGYNIILFAKEKHIIQVPVIQLENVIVKK